jgi:transposase
MYQDLQTLFEPQSIRPGWSAPPTDFRSATTLEKGHGRIENQQVEIAYGLAQQFVTLLKERNAQPLETWLWDCQMSGISDLVTFAQGLEKEGSALHSAFTLPYSNGPVEGKINKLKYIKRSMYGRSGFPLLRQRVLKAA